MTYPSVLLLGVVPSLTWAVARCIRRAGGKPVILAWHPFAPLRISGDCARYVRWHGLRKHGGRLAADALDQVRALCRHHAIDAVIGADVDTALLLAGDEAVDLPRCAVPDGATITTFNNKWNLTRLLAALDVPVPRSEYVHDERDLLSTRLDFPLITKPLDMWASVGFQVHASHPELTATVARRELTAPYPLIAQSFVPGCDSGASFLAAKGRLVACSMFYHRRRGRRQFHDDARVRGYLEAFVEATGYHGVGHVDLRYDPDAQAFSALELNPRFWASLLYAANAGLNYPDLLVRLPQWDGRTVHTATPGETGLPLYERAMTLSQRWVGAGYEKLSGAVL